MLTYQDTIIYDIHVLSGKYLIDNVNQAVDIWRDSEYKNIPFEDFCEYILPYRVTTEPITDWRAKYHNKFKWIGDSICNKSLENIPSGYMQHTNYKDVTHEYWETSDVTIPLFTDTV